MVAEDTNTESLAMVWAPPSLPNKMVSVCAALTTTLTTMFACFAASAGVLAPAPPSVTNRATASSETSQPVTSKPPRLSEVAMPKPIEPSPITATRGFELTESGMRRSLVCSLAEITVGVPLGITAWPRCQSMRQGGKEDAAMTETGLREEICRLGRSLFERGLTPGSSGNISAKLDDGWLVTPTNASLGSLGPARLSRLDGPGRRR